MKLFNRVLAFSAFAFVLDGHALTMSWVFDHNMILQADRPVPVWGQGTPGQTVTVSFGGQTNTTVVDSGGQWALQLASMPFSAEGRELRIVADSGTKVATNLLVGDVWVCSGQSNMAQPTMGQATGFEEETNQPLNHLIRAYYAPYNMWSAEPQTNNFSGPRVTNWHCWDTIAGRTPAVPYYFAKMLQANIDRPVGLLVVPVGASAAEAWVPLSSLLAETNFYSFATQTVSYIVNYSNNLAAFDAEYAEWEADKAAAESNSVPFSVPAPTKANRPEFSPRWWGGALYNSYIAPLRNMAVKGAIWYQGENNAAGSGGVAKTVAGYRALMEVLVQSWREQFAQPDLPFFMVQLSMFNWDDFAGTRPRDPLPGSWSIIREAQELAARSISHSGLAISVDIGEKDNIHPNNKRPVGERLARLALRDVYGKPVIADGPSYAAHVIEGGVIRVTFTNTLGGLVRGVRPAVTNNAVIGFALAGTNQTFYWANAAISGDEVVVSSTNVPQPVAVRYGYVQYHDVNLFNAEGLPAVPFRTDAWDFIQGVETPMDELDVVKGNNNNALYLPASWLEGLVPGSNLVALWNSTVTNASTVRLGESLVLGGIKIYDPGGRVAITNAAGETNTLTIGYSGIKMDNATVDFDIAVPVILSTSQSWNVKAGRILNNNGNFNTGGLNVDNQGHTLTFSGGGGVAITRMTGSGGLVVSGSGTNRIQSNGTYDFTGDVVLNNGLLKAGNRAGSLGSGASRLTLAGGRLEFISNLAVNYARTTTVFASSSIHNNNSGNNGAMTYTFRSLWMGPYTLSVTAQGTNAGSLVFGPVTLTGDAVFDVGSRATNHLRVGSVGEAGGSFGFTKRGIGTMVITNASSFTGATLIEDGSLALTGAGTIGASTSIVVQSLLDVSGVVSGKWVLGAVQTLGGTGEVKGAITATGRVAPGNGGRGVLRAGDMTWDSGAPWPFELGPVPECDRLQCGGNFMRGFGTNYVFDLQGTGAVGVYTLITWSASTDFSTGDFSVENTPAGLIPVFSIVDGALLLQLDEYPSAPPATISGIRVNGGGSPSLHWAGTPGQSFLIEAATALGPVPEANWSVIGTVLLDYAGAGAFNETNAPNSRYYRLRDTEF